MCDFKTAVPEASVLDPKKRVRYSTGLVLGVDEYRQTDLYFRQRDHLHQRSLHGYGTVAGLGVRVRAAASGRPEVLVAPGLAVTPRGESVCVARGQCAPLDDWLDSHEEEFAGSPPASPPETVRAWVTLCYRECETDRVPILGDPCRTLEDATAPSRIADDFELKLSLEAPDQEEEEVVGDFGDLLRSLEITEEPGAGLGPEELAELVRGLVPAGSPPIGSPPPGSPPEAPRIQRDDLPQALALAFRVWASEVRPRLASGAAGCAGGGEPCVLLAQLDFPVARTPQGELRVDGDHEDVTVDQRERPILLSTRVLQEWVAAVWSAPRFHHDLAGLDEDDHPHYLLVDPATRALVTDLAANGPGGPHKVTGLAAATDAGDAVRFEQAIKVGDTAGGDLRASYPDPQVRGLRGRRIDPTPPAADQVLAWDDATDRWRPSSVPAPPPPPHGALAGLGGDDHPQYLLVNPATRALVTDLPAAGSRVTGLAAATGAGDAVRFEQAIKVADAAGGDLRLNYPNPRVRRLQGRNVSTAAPATDDVLTWDGARWRPRPLPPSPGAVPDLLEDDLVRIVALSWRHDRTGALRINHDGNPNVAGLALAFGTDSGVFAAVDAGSLTPDTVRLWLRQPGQAPFFQHLEVEAEVVPVQPRAVSGDLITETVSTTNDPRAVLILFSESTLRTLLELRGRLAVEVRGDHVLDLSGRAIDAEFVRAELPTGARRAGAQLGIQGGRFESWLAAGVGLRPVIPGTNRGIDLNVATREELMTLPGIGGGFADRVIARREELAGFNSLADLRGALPASVLSALSQLIG